MSLRSRVRQIAYRYWNPDEHGVAPHRHGFNHGPTLADACVAQDDPEHQGHANAVRIHQSDCRAQQRKVILDWVRGQVGDDGVGERGRDEQGEDERGERPERPVEVGRGREVGGRVCGREGVERVDAAKEYLVTQWKFNSLKSPRVGERVIDWERGLTVLVSTSKWC